MLYGGSPKAEISQTNSPELKHVILKWEKNANIEPLVTKSYLVACV